MKRFSIILLLSIYSMATFGVSLKQFYCCGKLKSLTFSIIAENGKEKCGLGDNKEGCCKTKYHSFKVKDKHLSTEAFKTPPATYDNHLAAFIPAWQTVSFFIQQVVIINGSHAPPLFRGVPAYISNCVFRI